MIRFEDVSFSFPNQEVLDHVDFQMEDGEFVGILGPNGGGKTTFLRLALGLLKPQSGKIRISDQRVSYISQTTSTNDASFPATVQEVVALGLVNQKIHPFFTKAERQRVKETLEKMSLYELRNRLVSELSGGQQQRVKIAKALVNDPTLVVLDEPDAGMDDQSHEHLMETIEMLHEAKTSILFVSHHPHDLHHADHIYFIENGKILSYQEELERGHHHASL